MRRLSAFWVAIVIFCGMSMSCALGADPSCHAGKDAAVSLAFETYSGYFVSNQFEPEAAESYLAIASQQRFDEVFGVATVMNDRSHRLPSDIFKNHLVLAVIRRGGAVWEYDVKSVAASEGVVTLRYATTAKNSDSATFACPLIVSIPKDGYGAVRFEEGKKVVKTLRLGKP